VTKVVDRSAGRKSSTKLDLFNVPVDFFVRQMGDSGKNGRARMSGNAGTNPDSKV
jgi:hypothetical protein